MSDSEGRKRKLVRYKMVKAAAIRMATEDFEEKVKNGEVLVMSNDRF